jgi:hypothetical protein
MTTKWVGSLNADSVVSQDHVQAIEEIMVALDTANATEITSRRQDLALMGEMVKTIEGVPGTYELYESFSGFFQDDGDYLDPEEFETEYDSFNFKRKGYAVKNGSYDEKTYQDFEERGVDLDREISKKTVQLIAKYNNVYKPNIIFDALLTVPTDGAGAAFSFGTNFGAIRNYEIREEKLTNFDSTASDEALGSRTRNNWRTIADAAGISLADVNFAKEYMGDIEGIDEDNLLVFGTSSSLSKFQNLFSDFSPVQEEIIVGGIPSGVQGFTVNGFTMISVKTPFPRDMIAFVNPNAEYLISKLISPMEKYRGLAIEFPRDDEKFLSNTKGFQGAKLKIQSEGYHMTGVLDVLWMDIEEDASNASADRLMQTDGFTKVTTKKTALQRQWYKSVVERV